LHIIAVGLYVDFLAFYKAYTISATEWPSIIIEFHPNEANWLLKT
jgi:hypothetical protein